MEINTITSEIAVCPAIVPQLIENLPQQCKKINVDVKANFDELVKSQFLRFDVIPAKAGIQYIQHVLDAGFVIPDLIRDRHDESRTFCETINFRYPEEDVRQPLKWKLFDLLIIIF